MGITKDLQASILKDGRSQYALAKAAGLSPIQLGRFLRGERGLTTPTVDALCEVLGLTLTPKPKRRKSR
jgi:transcriptional regulator with XRE-family HTH domain